MGKRKLKRKRYAGKSSFDMDLAKGATVSCPVCNIRIPLLGIYAHVNSDHPDAKIDTSKIRSIGLMPRSKGNSSSGFGDRKRVGWPMAGGLPGLGKRR